MDKTITVKISGMHCNGCALGVRGALESLPQVRAAQVSYPKGEASVTCAGEVCDEAAIRSAVQKAGFEVTDIQ